MHSICCYREALSACVILLPLYQIFSDHMVDKHIKINYIFKYMIKIKLKSEHGQFLIFDQVQIFRFEECFRLNPRAEEESKFATSVTSQSFYLFLSPSFERKHSGMQTELH